MPEAELERLWQRLQPLVVERIPLAIIVRDGIVHLWISADEPLEKRQALRRGGKDPRRPRRHGT